MIVSVHSDINKRKENQDVHGHQKTAYGELLMICDGMGGAKAGHVAAEYTASRLPQLLDAAAQAGLDLEHALAEAVEQINRRIHELGNGEDPQYRGMGTTLVLALSTPTGFLIGHVGDSRAYLFRAGALLPLTDDHSHVAGLLAHGVITSEQARQHPIRNVLSRAIGPHPEAPLELRSERVVLKPGDALVLCSDGLCGSVEDTQICDLLCEQHDWHGTAERLVALAKAHGSADNITVMVAGHPTGPDRDSMRRSKPDLLPPPQPAAEPPAPSGRLTWVVLVVIVVALTAIFALRACQTIPAEEPTAQATAISSANLPRIKA